MKIKKLTLVIIIVFILIGLLIFFLIQKEKVKVRFPFIVPEEIVVELYFSSKDGRYLVKEERQIPKLDNRLKQAKAVINELMKGPKSKNLFPTIPQGTQLREIYLHKDTAYIDFSKELSSKHPGGSNGEIHTIFSIVNTLTFNFPNIKYVQLLVEGREIETIAGHIDTTMPFKQNLSLIQHKPKEKIED
jgi:germination protein M